MNEWAWPGAISHNCAFYRLLRLFFVIPFCHAILVNRTIDSNIGDPVTGFMPIYQPQSPSGIWADQSCLGCYIQPDRSKAFDGTWNAATYHPELRNVNLTLQFTGVAVWVFFILSNANSHGPGTTTNTQVNVTLDGKYMGTFSHNPDMTTEDLIYNTTIFYADNLANTPHEIIIGTNDYPISTFINFDWALYLAEVNTPTHPSHSTSSSKSSTFSKTSSTRSTSSTSSTPLTLSTATATVTIISSKTISFTASIHGASSTTHTTRAPGSRSSSSSINPSFPSTANPSTTSSLVSPTPATQSSSSNTGIIVAGTLGGSAVVAIALAVLIRSCYRQHPRHSSASHEQAGGTIPPHQPHHRFNPPVSYNGLNQINAARLGQVRSSGESGGPLVAGPSRHISNVHQLRNGVPIRQLRDHIGPLQAQQQRSFTPFSEPPPAYELYNDLTI